MKRMVFIIGSPDISGGTYVILQHALYLQQLGYDITIACCIEYANYLASCQANVFWHPGLRSLRVVSISDPMLKEPFDLAVLTWWRTVYHLSEVNTQRYVYFVQSIESRFYSAKDKALVTLVNDTYTFGLPVITEATWIKAYLHKHYGTNAYLAKNGIRKDIYTPEGKSIKPRGMTLRVLIEGPLNVPFKNTEKAIRLCQKVKGVECWLLTSSEVSKYSGVHRVFSRCSIEETAEVYRSCDVLLKLSYVEGMFGPPLEMFHCGGTCVVYDVTGHDEYISHGYNGLVIKTDDERGVVHALNQLKHDRDLLNTLKQGALTTAATWIGWDVSSLCFHEQLQRVWQDACNSALHAHEIHHLSKQAFLHYEMSVRLYSKRMYQRFTLFLKQKMKVFF